MGLRAWVLAGLLVAAAVEGGQGAWILTKAHLAQHLLERAWSASLKDGEPVRPWPWADTWPVARLTVPRLRAQAVILAGASGEALAFGPGLVDGSAPPGEPGNAVVAGHRDTHFAFVRHLVEDDLIVVEGSGGRVTLLRVVGAEIVDSRDAIIHTDASVPVISLVACWPFDAAAPGGALRYVVTARADGLWAETNRWPGSPGTQRTGDDETEIGTESVAQAAHENRG